MGLFDGNLNYGDPNTMGMFGILQALGQAAMPSRLPVPTGAVLAQAAGGAAAGAKAYDTLLKQQQAALFNAQVGKLQQEASIFPALRDAALAVNGGGTSPAPAAPNLSGEPVSPVAPMPSPAPAATPSAGAGNWEVRNNNFAGMRIPGVNAGPNAGGFQSFATPEAGLAALSHQLDRYAAGGVTTAMNPTGAPLKTLRQIVSVWAPPTENDTAGLINRASTVMGVGPDTPLDLSNPQTKAKLMEAMIRGEQGGQLPVDPSLIAKVAGGAASPPAAPVQMAQNAPAASGLPNIDPAALARLRDLGALAGFPQVGQGTAQYYYGSPAYKGQVASAEARAQTPEINARSLFNAQLDIGKAGQIAQANQNARASAQNTIEANTPRVIGNSVIYPPGSPGAVNFANAAKTGGALPAGVDVRSDGSVVVTPPNEGTFGQNIAELNAKDFFARRAVALDAVKSLQNAQEVQKLIDSGIITGTGANARIAMDNALATIGFTSSDPKLSNTQAYIATRAQEVGRMVKLFGSGTAISDSDRKYAERMAAGDITINEDSIRKIIRITSNFSRNIITEFNRDAEKIDPNLSPYPLTVRLPDVGTLEKPTPTAPPKRLIWNPTTHALEPAK